MLRGLQLQLLDEMSKEEQYIELFDSGTWGVFSTFYLVQRTDSKGKILDKPEVTPVRVKEKEKLPTPIVRYEDGHALVEIGDLGDGVEEVVVAKATTSDSKDFDFSRLDINGYVPTPAEIQDGSVVDLTDPAKLNPSRRGLPSTEKANYFLSIVREDAVTKRLAEERKLTEATDSAAGFLFTMVKKNGSWNASGLRPLADIVARVPVRVIHERDFLEDYYGGSSIDSPINPSDFPDALAAVTADGHVRSFPADAKRVKTLGSDSSVEFTVRGTTLSQVLEFNENDNAESIDEMIQRVNDYNPPTNGVPADADLEDVGETWTEAPSGTVEIPDHIFGTTEMTRYIATHLEQGYTEIDLSGFPESTTDLQIRSAIEEAVNQNPLILGEDFPKYSFDQQTKILHVTPQFAQVVTSDEEDRQIIKSRDEFLAVQSQVKQKAEQVIAEIISNGMDDREKAEAIDGWLAQNTVYSFVLEDEREEVLEREGVTDKNIGFFLDQFEMIQYLRTAKTHPHQTAAGPLLEGAAICSGYADAFQLLANEAGLQSIRVNGTAGTEGHAWNKVNIDGTWLNYDPTWNDQGEQSTNRFSGLTDQEIVGEIGERAFIWSMTVQAPYDDQFKNY